MDPTHPQTPPTPLAALDDVPPELLACLQALGIVTCEQAWELLVRVSAEGLSSLAGLSISMEGVTRLRQRLESIVPADVRLALAAAETQRWTQRHPLGALPPKDLDQRVREEGEQALGDGEDMHGEESR